MTTYTYETMTQDDANNFTANDYIVFSTQGSTASGATVTIDTTSTDGTDPMYTLTYAGNTLVFGETGFSSGVALEQASQSTGASHLIFDDGSSLYLADNGSNDIFVADSSSTSNVVYGFGGNDTIHLDGHDTSATGYIYGGLGADKIGFTDENGTAEADGNYHVFGNAAGGPDPSDGNDTITLGAGVNYVNGNAGDDRISVGVNALTPETPDDGDPVSASTNGNRVFGGNGNDVISIKGAGVNEVNGNMGRDNIDASTATGNNVIHGGKDNDVISAGQGHDQIYGDLGSDRLVVSGTAGHITVLTGGTADHSSTDAGDLFDFHAAGAGDASLLDTSSAYNASTNAVYYQEITDFTHNQDVIDLGTGVNPTGASNIGYATTNFSSVHDAEQYAIGQLNGTTTVSSLSVNGDTYLFYKSATATDASTGINGVAVIHLDGVTASTITSSDFGSSIVG